MAEFKFKDLSEFEEYVEVCRRMYAATAALDTARTALETARNARLRSEARQKHIDMTVNALMKGDVAPIPTSGEYDVERLEDQERVARELLFRINEEFESTRSKCARAIVETARPRHKEILRRALGSTLELSKALNDEAEFIEGLIAAGAGTAALGLLTLPIEIKNAVGLFSSRESGANIAGRYLSEYLGTKSK
jgi:hypothetical protein